MHQLSLPFVSKNTIQINALVSVWCDESCWTYFIGMNPIYSHPADDHNLFRLTVAQLINSGTCRQTEVINALGISKSSADRALKKYRNHGANAFFKKRRTRKGGTILTEDVLAKAQLLLDQGYTRQNAAEELGVKYDTLRKAISDGRLSAKQPHEIISTKSRRSVVDAAAAEGMGTACTRVGERLAASVGLCVGAAVEFETCYDVPKGGVLCALPALLENGLLHGIKQKLGEVGGYYTAVHVLLLIAFMALCRIKTTEKIRGQSPGEFGKLLGLDRIPEVRCLRNKLDALCAGDGAERWAAHLADYWMNAEPEAVGTLYIDGHVRVYHGHSARLPRRFVSRQRLCLRGTTDYWVNDAIGRPFFAVEKVVDPGLLETLRADIVPRLLADIPNQPTDADLKNKPLLSRFILVFDREGYSPAFFAKMWQKYRIACLTYHKYPGQPWPSEEFTEYETTLPRGETVNMRLCERGSLVGTGKNAVWMREVRKLTESGHQTSIISTAFDLPLTQLAARLFSRWCQENFFRYMMQHFDIDRVIEYGRLPFPDTEMVINPAWRELNRRQNSLAGKLKNRLAKFAALDIHPENDQNSKKYEKWLKKKSELLEVIEEYEQQKKEVKAKIKDTDKHIAWQNLDEQDKFYQLKPGRKRLMDTVRMIAYRAETAMAGLLTGPIVDLVAAKQLLQDLFVTEADIIPDADSNQLLIRVHGASRPAANRSLGQLFNHLNKARIKYPGTDMLLVYELGVT